MGRTLFSGSFEPPFTGETDGSEVAYPYGKPVIAEFTPVPSTYGPGLVRAGDPDNIPELAIKARQKVEQAYNETPPTQL